MSNAIAPGSSADVNVQVRALGTDPNVSVQYKTVILKKNIVNGVNTLTQAMMSDENTKYVIKYDYVLGSDITIPANCVLDFDGGSISAGSGQNMDTITGANTGIQAGLVKIFNINVTLAGTWDIIDVYSEWFGAVSDGITNVSTELQKALNLASISKGQTVRMLVGMYKVSNITVPMNTTLKGIKPSGKSFNGTLFVSDDINNPVIKPQEGAVITDLGFWYPTQTSETPIEYPASIYVGNACNYVNIRNIAFLASFIGIEAGYKQVNLVIDNCVGAVYKYGIHIVHAEDIDRISNCHFNYNILLENTEYTQSYNPSYIANYSAANGIAYYVEHGDWITFTNCFAILFSEGFHFGVYHGEYHVNNALIHGGGADYCKIGFALYNNVGTKISNVTMHGGDFTNVRGMVIGNSDNIRIVNSTMESMEGHFVLTYSADNILFNGCCFNAMRTIDMPWMFYLQSTKEFVLMGCEIKHIKTGILYIIGATVRLLNNWLLFDSETVNTFNGEGDMSADNWVEARNNIYKGWPNVINKTYLLNAGPTSHLDSVPRFKTLYEGFEYYDTTTSKPVYWTGNAWKDANGNSYPQS